MRISDWSSDVCSSDLPHLRDGFAASHTAIARLGHVVLNVADFATVESSLVGKLNFLISDHVPGKIAFLRAFPNRYHHSFAILTGRSEEHTSELQSLMRISYAVFCLKKKTNRNQ